ncbi:MAG TPA: hypothetical protein PLV45_08885 [bacterium]|nr:hypothetical protein [bacterium]
MDRKSTHPEPTGPDDATLQQYVTEHYHSEPDFEKIPLTERLVLFRNIFLNHHEMIREPEFSEIQIDTDYLLEVYLRADRSFAEEHEDTEGMSRLAFDAVSEELIRRVTLVVLETSLREQLLESLNAVIERAGRDNNPGLRADAAVHLFTLRNGMFEEIWPSMAVCRGIVRRSLDTLYGVESVFENLLIVEDEF